MTSNPESSSPPSWFRTKEIPYSERRSLWEEYITRQQMPLAVTPIHDRPLEAIAAGVKGEGLRFAHIAGSAQVAARGAKQRQQTECRLVGLELVERGQGLFKDANSVRVVTAGQGIIFDANGTFSMAFEKGMRESVLMVPYDLLEPSAIPTSPRIFSFDQPGTLGHAMADVIRNVLRSPELVAGAERDARDLFPGLLPRGYRSLASYRLQALDLLRSRFADADLSGETSAQALGISERHLRRAFANEEGGVGRALLSVRLEAAAGLLVDPGSRSLSIAELAARCGIESQSFFSREFKKKYNVTPREYRRERGFVHDSTD
ncbi:AraC family transcriptional regulator [Arthrobacter sp. TS-15]|uniref:AraC family transcriptional regulator n=1 Tax=Arthrobacter sp. TS-15 TaxID=2510797 RepID=UPI00115CC9EF|nr:AraC family transcriptional regulator [Arthrobacter sp. TS-15]TQS88918.1 AraC family transcriptional regulator [Arthrobacter sp. TS-15]